MIREYEHDDFNLLRFVDAQSSCIETVFEELAVGEKQSHWMWFIFPQLEGLGATYTSRQFSIKSLEEAKAYLRHPILGKRIVDCTSLVIKINGRNIKDIFGNPDYLKFRSSMTLFSIANERLDIFKNAIDKFYTGNPDKKTLDLLGLTWHSQL